MCPALDDRFTEDAVCLAKKWQDRANVLLDPAEKRRTRQLARLVANADDKIILTALIDQGFRSGDARRVADQIHHLLSAHGIPRFFECSKWLVGIAGIGVGAVGSNMELGGGERGRGH